METGWTGMNEVEIEVLIDGADQANILAARRKPVPDRARGAAFRYGLEVEER